MLAAEASSSILSRFVSLVSLLKTSAHERHASQTRKIKPNGSRAVIECQQVATNGSNAAPIMEAALYAMPDPVKRDMGPKVSPIRAMPMLKNASMRV